MVLNFYRYKTTIVVFKSVKLFFFKSLMVLGMMTIANSVFHEELKFFQKWGFWKWHNLCYSQKWHLKVSQNAQKMFGFDLQKFRTKVKKHVEQNSCRLLFLSSKEYFTPFGICHIDVTFIDHISSVVQKWIISRLCSFYKVEVFKFLIKNLSKVARFFAK